VLAFDTGPGNMVLDSVVVKATRGRSQFDRNGAEAARGKISERLLAELLAHPFLKRKPPKTTGREEFGEAFAQNVERRAAKLRLSHADLLATLTAFTTKTIARAYAHFVFPRANPTSLGQLEIILGGGGAANATLRRMLSSEVRAELAKLGIKAEPKLLSHSDFGIENQVKEALAFAILGYETLQQRPSNVPSATGARRAVVLGKIVPP
jgi:anhydro-N-acetylmuramic acid kinase